MVVPTNSRLKVFTTHDVENIDSKAQGNFSLDEFRGYALSVTSHLSHENPEVKRAPIKPDYYMIQPPVELTHTDVFAPRLGDSEVRPPIDVGDAKLKDEAWMIHVTRVLKQDTFHEGDVITWSGYNSLLASIDSVKPPAEIGVCPLFPDEAASASSMKHAMELTMQGTEFFTPGQTSILGADQPLYAIIKRIQWQCPDTLGEDKLVAMTGALHIEDQMHLLSFLRQRS